METVVLHSNSKKNLKLITELALKIGVSVKYLTNDEKEDIGLAVAIKNGRTGKFVDTDEFIEKLSK
jgi:hypothetical protein